MENGLKKLTDLYLDARAHYEDMHALTAEAKKKMEDAEAQLLSAMTDLGLDSLRTDDGVGFTRQRKLSYACLAENRPELLNRLEKEGYRELFTVSAQTLNALMKEKVAASEDGMLPPEYADIISEHEEPKLSVRGRKKAK